MMKYTGIFIAAILFLSPIGFNALAQEQDQQEDTVSVRTVLDSMEVTTETTSEASATDLALITYPSDLDTHRLSLVFAGDIMGHDTQIIGAFDPVTKTYNYEPTFRYIKEFIADADIAIGNLEVTLAGPPYKGYPQFSSPDALAVEARKAGFDIMVTANNHSLDRGADGFVRTLNVLDSLEFLRAGTYYDSMDRDTLYPLVVEKNSIRIALLNYTYGTNGLRIVEPYIVNRIDTAQISKDLRKAKLANPDYIIVVMHWGKEYERTENAQQVRLAEHVFRQGADALIGSHPHVVQPVKYLYLDGDSIKAYPVVYSMGNFVSNQRAQYKDGGIMPELHLEKIGNKVRLASLTYLPYWVWREDRNNKSTFYVLPVSRYEADKDAFPLTPSDIYRLERFSSDTRTHLKNILESDYFKK